MFLAIEQIFIFPIKNFVLYKKVFTFAEQSKIIIKRCDIPSIR